MKRNRWTVFSSLLGNSLAAVLIVTAFTAVLELIGSKTLGDAVIALLYLVPISWSASRWGLGPGLCAALAAALYFDFLFIPPYYTFAVGRLEGWLVLAIFLGVAAVVVERIQSAATRAKEAVFMYELSAALAAKRTQEAAAAAVARQIQRLFRAARVNVGFRPQKGADSLVLSQPKDAVVEGPPDRVIPIENAWGLVGEIQIWRGDYADLPADDSRILRNFAWQAAEALERTRMMEIREAAPHPGMSPSGGER